MDYLKGFISGLAIMMPAVLLALSITVESCNKDFNDRNYPDPTPQTEQAQTVYQSFGVTIKTGTSQMDAKSWDATTWVYKYSTVPANLVLTGTGASVGQNYTQSCTVAQLQAGTVSINMLPGTYQISFVTPHIQTSDSYSTGGHSLAELVGTPPIGDVLDIKIDNTTTVTGTPLSLTATLEDALVIIDISNESTALASKTNAFGSILPKLLNTYYSSQGVLYGYVNAGLWLKLNISARIIDGTGYVKGNAYHLISAFQASSSLIIPNMTVQNVIVP